MVGLYSNLFKRAILYPTAIFAAGCGGGGGGGGKDDPIPPPEEVAPQITISASDTSLRNLETITITSTKTQGTEPVTYKIDWESDGVPDAKNSNGIFSLSPTTGDYTVTIKATNIKGSDSKTIDYGVGFPDADTAYEFAAQQTKKLGYDTQCPIDIMIWNSEDELMEQLNGIYRAIQFTSEGEREFYLIFMDENSEINREGVKTHQDDGLLPLIKLIEEDTSPDDLEELIQKAHDKVVPIPITVSFESSSNTSRSKPKLRPCNSWLRPYKNRIALRT